MRGKGTRGYVLKVAVASASIGLTAACGKSDMQQPVGTVASPQTIGSVASPALPVGMVPAPLQMPYGYDAGAIDTTPPEVGTVARAPDASAPKPHKVGLVGPPPDVGLTVGTTARAPDSKP